jgi:hypothetical protein
MSSSTSTTSTSDEVARERVAIKKAAMLAGTWEQPNPMAKRQARRAPKLGPQAASRAPVAGPKRVPSAEIPALVATMPSSFFPAEEKIVLPKRRKSSQQTGVRYNELAGYAMLHAPGRFPVSLRGMSSILFQVLPVPTYSHGCKCTSPSTSVRLQVQVYVFKYKCTLSSVSVHCQVQVYMLGKYNL